VKKNGFAMNTSPKRRRGLQQTDKNRGCVKNIANTFNKGAQAAKNNSGEIARSSG